MKRVIFDIVLFFAVFVMPWWTTIALALFGLCIFIRFYEFIFAASVMYALHAIVGSPFFLSSPLIFALCTVAVYVLVESVQRYIILFKS